MTDIEKALAKALHDFGIDQMADYAESAAIILATEPMQAIARQAAIGAAVERLQRYRSSFMLDWHPNAWLVTVRAIPKSKGVASTLPEAIAAALEDAMTDPDSGTARTLTSEPMTDIAARHRRRVSGDGYFEPYYDVCIDCAQDWPCDVVARHDARKHPPETVAIVAHTPPFDSVRDEGRRP